MTDGVAELPDWRSDWLYALVLREAEKDWAFCRRKPDGKHWRYVLIGEWSASSEPRIARKLIRAWVRDEQGLREIAVQEYTQHKRKIHSRVCPFVVMSFRMEPDRQRVVIGHRQASLAGHGSTYHVRGEGAGATLEVDPQGERWRS